MATIVDFPAVNVHVAFAIKPKGEKRVKKIVTKFCVIRIVAHLRIKVDTRRSKVETTHRNQERRSLQYRIYIMEKYFTHVPYRRS